jgi:glutamate-1-semialdehyde 2,1-aminomutase
MNPSLVISIALLVLLVILFPWLCARVRLSRAKRPSLRGHARIAKAVAKRIPGYEFDEACFFSSDKAPDTVAAQRRRGFQRLAALLGERNQTSSQILERLATGVSDVQFVSRYQVPFQYSRLVRERLKAGVLVTESSGVTVTDLSGNLYYDLTGAYGVNVFGYDFYKVCIEAGSARVRRLGPVLGAYHPIVEDNVRRLQALSGLDKVSPFLYSAILNTSALCCRSGGFS